MELYQLKTFVAVAEAGNLSRAAKALAMSQPAVSAQIKSLEDELGLPIFERTPKGMVLTRDGHALLIEARQVLSSSDNMLAAARRLRGVPAGVVRVGALPDPEALRLGPWLSLVGDTYPSLRIELHHAASVAIRHDILAGQLDCGFILGPSEEGLSRRSLAPIRLVVALPPRCAVGDDASWVEVADLPWIGTPTGCPFQILAQDLFTAQRRAPHLGLQVDIEPTIVESVAAGLGASLLREDTARLAAAEGKCRIWPGTVLDSEFAFVWPTARSAVPALAALRAAVARVWSPND